MIFLNKNGGGRRRKYHHNKQNQEHAFCSETISKGAVTTGEGVAAAETQDTLAPQHRNKKDQIPFCVFGRGAQYWGITHAAEEQEFHKPFSLCLLRQAPLILMNVDPTKAYQLLRTWRQRGGGGGAEASSRCH